jgi:hypothetical protein
VNTDYKWIRAWGRMMGSYDYYINGEVERARADRAPQNAIFKRDSGWATTAGIQSDSTKENLRQIAGPLPEDAAGQ